MTVTAVKVHDIIHDPPLIDVVGPPSSLTDSGHVGWQKHSSHPIIG